MLDLTHLRPKRRAADGGVDAWYPYYAGFSLPFAESALRALDPRRSDRVLDPWVGSGTTLAAARALGIKGVGIDLNPFAALVTSAKLISSHDADVAVRVAQEIVDAHPTMRWGERCASDDPLRRWLPPGAAGYVQFLRDEIARAFGLLNCLLAHESRSAAFLLLCLIRSARACSGPVATANPTWYRPGVQHGLRASRIRDLFLSTVKTLALEVPASATHAEVLVGDARRLPLEDQSVDLVLTSPPYCTRLDYAVATDFELAILGALLDDRASELRRGMMGTTVIRHSQDQEMNSDWPTKLKNLLSAVRRHPSHGSGSYYFRNLRQYFADAADSLAEIARVLRPKGSALVVLQTSYYKEIEIDLPGLFISLGEKTGLSGKVAATVPVGRVMSSLNIRSKKYGSRRCYRECVVIFRRES